MMEVVNLFDPNNVARALFYAGVVYGSIRAGIAQSSERQLRQGREITRLRQYKAWSHRAISVLSSHCQTNHKGQYMIEDWREVDEGDNGG